MQKLADRFPSFVGKMDEKRQLITEVRRERAGASRRGYSRNIFDDVYKELAVYIKEHFYPQIAESPYFVDKIYELPAIVYQNKFKNKKYSFIPTN